MKHETRITRYTIAPEGEPIFSELATHVEIDDEAAGEFVVIKQEGGSSELEKRVAFNEDEFAIVCAAARNLFRDIKKRSEKDGEKQ